MDFEAVRINNEQRTTNNGQGPLNKDHFDTIRMGLGTQAQRVKTRQGNNQYIDKNKLDSKGTGADPELRERVRGGLYRTFVCLVCQWVKEPTLGISEACLT